MLRLSCALALVAWSPAVAAQVGVEPPIPLPRAPLPAPRAVVERGTSPLYYRLSPRIVLPLVRGGFGVQVRSAPGDAASFAATFDMLGGVIVRADRGSRFGFIAEAGYSYSGFSQHLASIGVGALTGLGAVSDPEGRSGMPTLRVAIAARGLAGVSYERSAVGARTSLFVGGAYYTLEVAHQILFVDGVGSNEFRLTLTTLLAFGESP